MSDMERARQCAAEIANLRMGEDFPDLERDAQHIAAAFREARAEALEEVRQAIGRGELRVGEALYRESAAGIMHYLAARAAELREQA